MKHKKIDHGFSILTELEKQLPFYLIGTGFQYRQESISRPFGYPYFQWIQTESGIGEISILDGKVVEMPRGQGMLLYPEDAHAYHGAGDEPWLVSWFTFGGHHIAGLLKTFQMECSGIYRISHQEPLTEIVEKAFNILQSTYSLKYLECSSLVYNFVLALYQYTSQREETMAITHGRLDLVFSYIEEHFQQLITIEDLASVLRITPQYLCQLFKKSLKMRPFEYVNIFRINKSKSMLFQHLDWPVEQVAKTCGYENPAYFSSLFKKIVGITPSQFRRRG